MTTGREWIRVFAPGSVGNLACGFDVLGLALEAPGDVVEVRTSSGPGVRIEAVTGDGGRLPTDPRTNSAAAAAQAVLDTVDAHTGLTLVLRKGLPLAAGLGGSAASAVAAAVAADACLDAHLPTPLLLHCALRGEAVAAGAPHPDNAAPSLLGGIVLVPDPEEVHPISLPVPEGLSVAVVRPRMEVETARARAVLGGTVPLRDAVRQWGRTAALVAALYEEDWDLLARAVADAVVEPQRAPLVPGFHEVKAAALDAGALAASLSGAGPALFALTRGRERASKVGAAMVAAFRDAAGLEADLVVSRADAPGARILGSEDAP